MNKKKTNPKCRDLFLLLVNSLTILKICEESLSFTFAVIMLCSVWRDKILIFIKQTSNANTFFTVFASMWQQSLLLIRFEFSKFLSQEPCFLFSISLLILISLIYMYYAWPRARISSFKVQVSPCLWVVFLYYNNDFKIFWKSFT